MSSQPNEGDAYEKIEKALNSRASYGPRLDWFGHVLHDFPQYFPNFSIAQRSALCKPACQPAAARNCDWKPTFDRGKRERRPSSLVARGTGSGGRWA